MSRTRRQQAVDESYQVDAVVALVAILLVIMIVLAAATMFQDGETYLVYAPEEEETEPFLLESIQTPYRFREIWFLDETALYRFDQKAIAARLLTQAGDALNPLLEDGLSIAAQFDVNSPPSSYQLTISRTGILTQGALIDQIVDHSDTDALQLWESKGSQLLVFVARDAWPLLPLLTQELRASERPFRVVPLVSNDANIEISRSRFNFEQNKIMRNY